MGINKKQLNEIINFIKNSNNKIDNAVRTITNEKFGEDDLTESQLQYINLQYKKCDNCNYWEPINNYSEENEICKDCMVSMDEEM